MESNNLRYVTENLFDLQEEDRVVGSYLYDRYQESVGRVRGLLVDPESFEVRYAVLIDGGFLLTEGKTLLLPRSLYRPLDMGKVKTVWSRESIQQAPTVTTLEAIPLNEEQVVLSYFDLPPYWETASSESED